MFVGLEMGGQSLCKVQTNSQLGVLLSWGKKKNRAFGKAGLHKQPQMLIWHPKSSLTHHSTSESTQIPPPGSQFWCPIWLVKEKTCKHKHH